MTTPPNPRTRSGATPSAIGATANDEASAPTTTNPGTTPTTNTNTQLATVLAQLTDRLTHTGTSRSNIKHRIPDTFDGKDKNKLRSFLQQCEAVFTAKEREFENDHDKITFTGTYLTGQPLNWYLRMVQEQDSTLYSWTEFMEKLKTAFGHPNEEAWAENRLSQLRMYSNQDCMGYVTRFRDYADILEWDDKALMSSFKRGLPDRLLDELGRLPNKPFNLEELIGKTLDIDERYWENQSFKEQREPNRYSNIRRRETNNYGRHRNNKFQSSNTTRYTSTRQIKTEENDEKSHDKGKATHLDKEGKITQQERSRRMRLGLCMFCSEKGHLRVNCPQLEKRNNASTSTVSTVIESSN